MAKKISFSVENAEVISENPNSNFAIASLDFFASGDSLNNTYVSEETLMRTAKTIKNCPLVWKYDEERDDIYTHDRDEVPCGFVPDSSEVKSRKLPDGRTMLSVIAYVWKRYTGEILNIFKRDGGEKPVSVEVSVYDVEELPDGRMELLDYKYEGITMLGSLVTPAIPMARANILTFSEMEKEYNEDLKKEFYFSDIDMTIPDEIRENAKKGIDLKKKDGKGGSSVSVSFAKYLVKSEDISEEKIRYMNEYFSKLPSIKPKDTTEYLLMGGDKGLEWCSETVSKMDDADKHFKDTHERKNGKWVKKEKMNMKDEKNMSLDEETVDVVENVEGELDNSTVIEEEFSEDTIEEKPDTETEETEDFSEEEDEEEVLDMAEDDKEDSEEDDKEKFEFPFNVEAMTSMFAEDEDEEIKMAIAEMSKEFSSPSIVMAGMFCKMLKMAQYAKDMEEKNKAYMEENEELKKYKADIEEQQKFAKIDRVLFELNERFIIPEESLDEFKASAEKYSLDELNVWETECKAKSFDFAIKEESKDGIGRVGLPFSSGQIKPKNDIWNGTK